MDSEIPTPGFLFEAPGPVSNDSKPANEVEQLKRRVAMLEKICAKQVRTIYKSLFQQSLI